MKEQRGKPETGGPDSRTHLWLLRSKTIQDTENFPVAFA